MNIQASQIQSLIMNIQSSQTQRVIMNIQTSKDQSVIMNIQSHMIKCNHEYSSFTNKSIDNLFAFFNQLMLSQG